MIQTSPAFFSSYADRLSTVLQSTDWSPVRLLAERLESARQQRQQIFLCGNGGSAANALHIANDLSVALFKGTRDALRAHALPANVAALTCVANDLSYSQVFSQQLRVMGNPGDILVVLSGSGNSPNILEALKEARNLGMHSVAVLGFDGGAAIKLADHSIHFPLDDMQIVEDLQLVVGHMVMRFIASMNPSTSSRCI